jgi:acetylornithine deacetylase/succinyl-diaminopimelate desuccinylase-like protein
MPNTDASADLAARIAQLMPRARTDLAELVAFPSVADPRQIPPEVCRSAAEWVAAAFAEAGLSDVHLAETPDGTHAVIGHRPGPPGAPTVLLYSHYDVQPALDTDAWVSPPFELTERDGRWYGRGAADCKGNIVMHLTALRALGDDLPVGIKIVIEGSEEQGTGGLEQYLPEHADQLRADAIVIADVGNAALGEPTATVSLRGAANVVVTVRTLAGDVHSGMFGGAAPDALAALIRMLDSLREADGSTRIEGLEAADGVWDGRDYDEQRFRRDVAVADGVSLIGTGTVADRLWAKPAVTVIGIDCPPVVGSVPAVPALARAHVSLRVPPGTSPQAAAEALEAHLLRAAPWGVQAEVEIEGVGSPFRAKTDGPGYAALDGAMRAAYGKPISYAGQGGSIPLCGKLAEVYPDAEIMLIGVEEPSCQIHAANESVDPGELERMALVEALFLRDYPGARENRL